MICSSCGRETDRKNSICSFCGKETSFATLETVAPPAPTICSGSIINNDNASGKNNQKLVNIESRIDYLKKVQDNQAERIEKLLSRSAIPTALLILIVILFLFASVLSIAASSVITNRAISKLKEELTCNIVQEVITHETGEQEDRKETANSETTIDQTPDDEDFAVFEKDEESPTQEMMIDESV